MQTISGQASLHSAQQLCVQGTCDTCRARCHELPPAKVPRCRHLLAAPSTHTRVVEGRHKPALLCLLRAGTVPQLRLG